MTHLMPLADAALDLHDPTVADQHHTETVTEHHPKEAS